MHSLAKQDDYSYDLGCKSEAASASQGWDERSGGEKALEPSGVLLSTRLRLQGCFSELLYLFILAWLVFCFLAESFAMEYCLVSSLMSPCLSNPEC